MNYPLAAIVAALAALPAGAAAAPAQQLHVAATVVKSCDFDPIPAASLGTYNWHAGIDTTVTGGLTVRCNAGVLYSISSNRGLNGDGSQNFLASGSSLLGYTLLIQDGNGNRYDPATNVGSGAVNEVASGSTDSYGLVLSVPTAQMVPAGAYADTVSFSLNY